MLILIKRISYIVLALSTILFIAAMTTPNESPGEIMARIQALGKDLAKTIACGKFIIQGSFQTIHLL